MITRPRVLSQKVLMAEREAEVVLHVAQAGNR